MVNDVGDWDLGDIGFHDYYYNTWSLTSKNRVLLRNSPSKAPASKKKPPAKIWITMITFCYYYNNNHYLRLIQQRHMCHVLGGFAFSFYHYKYMKKNKIVTNKS